MRKTYTKTLNLFFCKQLLRRRRALGISQEEMARRLAMSHRTYIELEHGKAGCGALTLTLFLIYLCPEPLEFLEDLRCAFDAESSNVA